MTPREEIELIVNTAYLRGCDSNFKTAIAAMQEEERSRLNKCGIAVWGDGYVSALDGVEHICIYGCENAKEAAETVNTSIHFADRERLAELVELIKPRRNGVGLNEMLDLGV